MKANRPRRIRLAVAEVKDMIESLQAAKTVKHLSGPQRRQLQNAHDALVKALDHAKEGTVQLPTILLVKVLRCATMTQQWLSEMLANLSVVNLDE
jgi:hypothetical protein